MGKRRIALFVTKRYEMITDFEEGDDPFFVDFEDDDPNFQEDYEYYESEIVVTVLKEKE